MQEAPRQTVTLRKPIDRTRYAGMDELGNYQVFGLGAHGDDVTIMWEAGTLSIIDQHDGTLIDYKECDSFAQAEKLIEATCLIVFDHEEIHWSPPRRERIARPLERKRFA